MKRLLIYLLPILLFAGCLDGDGGMSILPTPPGEEEVPGEGEGDLVIPDIAVVDLSAELWTDWDVMMALGEDLLFVKRNRTMPNK